MRPRVNFFRSLYSSNTIIIHLTGAARVGSRIRSLISPHQRRGWCLPSRVGGTGGRIQRPGEPAISCTIIVAHANEPTQPISRPDAGGAGHRGYRAMAEGWGPALEDRLRNWPV